MNDKSMVFNFHEAFNLSRPIGINYEGGVLSESVRQTIQMMHRIGALIVTIYLFGFSIFAMRRVLAFPHILRSIYTILGLLFIQLCLGITNVMFKLPLHTAISHTVIAVLLLLSVITLIYKLSNTSSKVVT